MKKKIQSVKTCGRDGVMTTNNELMMFLLGFIAGVTVTIAFSKIIL